MSDIEITQTEPLAGLSLLRKPFADNQISKLPKPTKKQTEEVKADFKKGKRCTICGTWHHPDVVHLDYVGHAALTNRLLDCDPHWIWEPLAVGADGYPVIDKDGGLWIKLTVCGITRLGYGDAQGKTGGDAMKERIGDALRNAAMRFGAALDLWHKGAAPLHDDDSEPEVAPKIVEVAKIGEDEFKTLNTLMDATETNKEKFCTAYGVSCVKDLPLAKFAEATKALNEKLRRKKVSDEAQAHSEHTNN